MSLTMAIAPCCSQSLILTNPIFKPMSYKPFVTTKVSFKPVSLSCSIGLATSCGDSVFINKPFIKASVKPMSVCSSNGLATHAELLSGSTRTLTTLFSLALVVSKAVAGKAVEVGPAFCSAAGPAFFAALKDRPSGALNTPLTVVAAGLAKWLDIYSGVLMVRVLLSWFPNIPWEKQPLSAIRDLCDPYLNLFRNIIPPIFDTLDVSPLLAFAVLGTMGSILNSSRGAS